MDISNPPSGKVADLVTAIKALLLPLGKTDIGLSEVDNTSDVNKPVSTLQLIELNKKANLISPAFQQLPTAPTAVVGTDTHQLATTKFVNATVQNYIGLNTEVIDVLRTLVEQLGDDPDAISGLFDQLSGKMDKSANLGDVASIAAARTNLGLGTAALVDTTAFAPVDHSHPLATASDPGFISAAEKNKLATIVANATQNQTDAYLLSRANHTGTQAISTIVGLQTAIDSKQPNIGYIPLNAAEKGAANGIAPLGSDSKIPESYIPAVAITDTFPVATQAAMLALTAQRGDIAVRSDENKTYILQAEPASTLANWVELKVPSGVVTSVAGKTGAVSLVIGDVASLQSSLDAKLSKTDHDFQIAAGSRLLGRYSPSAGVAQEIGLGTGLQFNGSNLEAKISEIITAPNLSPVVSNLVHTAPSEITPVALDELALFDSTSSWAIKRLTMQQNKAFVLNEGATSGYRNKIINGTFDVWQRGLTQVTTSYGSDDRWRNGSSGSTKTHSRQGLPLGSGVPGIYFSRTVVNAGTGATDQVYKQQRISSVYTLEGKRATLTFWAKADAAKPIAVKVYQYFGTGGSPSASATIDTRVINLTTSWAKYTYVMDVPSLAGKTRGTNGDDCISVEFWFDAGSGVTTVPIGHQSGTFDLAAVSFVEGDATLEDDPGAWRDLSVELALCYQFFYRLVTSWGIYSYGAAGQTVYWFFYLPSVMRFSPTVTLSQAPTVYSNASGLAVSAVYSNMVRLSAVVTAQGVFNIAGFGLEVDAEI